MNGVSTGAVNGARAAYDIHAAGSNQEHQGVRKTSNNTSRQRSTSNLRAPLSNAPAGRKGLNENGQTYQRPANGREDGAGAPGNMIDGKQRAEGQENIYRRNGSNGDLSNTENDDIPENMYRPEKEDLEGWIHREKLAKIENEELQAAGINLAKARSRSRDNLGNRTRTASRDRLRNDFPATDTGTTDERAQQVSSPTPAQINDEHDTVDRGTWDFRSEEEKAADPSPPLSYSTPVLRKSGSKIPILTTSPTASPSETPIPRKRTMSGSVSTEDGLSSAKIRAVSSKKNEEVETPPQNNSSKASSPTKLRQKSVSGVNGTSSTGKSTTTTRKTSTSTKVTPSSPTGRPRTRGNDMDRPRTAVNPPEGDPPWLADMYKPDPMLPPDQQLIPTLAKKQRQMQWEQNGMIPKTYDKQFTALAVHENNEPPPQQPRDNEVSAEKAEQPDSWPLKPMPSVRSGKEASVKSGTSGTPATTGGYSTMPKVSSPPMSMMSPKIGSSTNLGAPSPNIGPTRTPSATTQQAQQAQRPQQRPLTDEEDEKAQKKGCACCVVM